MAIINLLKGEFTGQLGNVIGKKCHDKCIVQAKSTNVHVNTSKRKKSFSAFRPLVVFTSDLARLYWDYLGIKADKMTYNNALCKRFKALRSNNRFDFEKITDTVGEMQYFYGQSSAFSALSSLYYFQIAQSTPIYKFEYIRLLILAVQSNGAINASKVLDNPDGYYSFMTMKSDFPIIGLILLEIGYFKSRYEILGGQFMKNTSISYSFQEQLSGDFWLNGKPIYQKSIQVVFTSTGQNLQFDPAILDLDSIIDLKGVIFPDNTSSYTFPSVYNVAKNITWGGYISENKINMIIYDEVLMNVPVYLTLFYTKMADIAEKDMYSAVKDL